MTPEERAKELGVPLIPKRPEPRPNYGNAVVAVCGECGLEIQRVMGYACNRPNCPTGLGGVGCTFTRSI